MKRFIRLYFIFCFWIILPIHSQSQVSLGLIGPDDCSNLPLFGEDLEYIAGTIGGSCTQGTPNSYYLGFYTYDDFELALGLQYTSQIGGVYYDGTSVYGPFLGLTDGCFAVNSGLAPMLVDNNAGFLMSGSNSTHYYSLTPVNTTVAGGFYIIEVRVCGPLLGHNAITIDIEVLKDIPCSEPCNPLVICDEPPCDTLTVCDWYPLLCDPCVLDPASCDPGGGSPPPCGNTITTIEELDCPTCIDRFAPTPGEVYMFEAWVREEGATAVVLNYQHPKLRLRFFDGFDSPIGGVIVLSASGPMIEGWQQISESVTIPQNAVRMEFELFVASGDAYFDDIRVSPFNSAMKTYVYDQQNMRLVAELDERNFATFYQYDEEGRMVAVKKETSRGIKTIQGIQQNTSTANVTN